MIDGSRGRSYEHATSAYECEHTIDRILVTNGDNISVILLHKKSDLSHLMTIADSRNIRSSSSDYTYVLRLSSFLIEIFYNSSARSSCSKSRKEKIRCPNIIIDLSCGRIMMNLRIFIICILIRPIIFSWILTHNPLYNSKWWIRIMRIWTLWSWWKTLDLYSYDSQNIFNLLLFDTISDCQKTFSTEICKNSESLCSISTWWFYDILTLTLLEYPEGGTIFHWSKRIEVLEFCIYLNSSKSVDFFRYEKEGGISDMFYYGLEDHNAWI